MSNERSVMAVIRAARPTFRNHFDKLAFAVHASFVATGHLLIATGPSADTAFTSPSTSTDEVGIDHWNEQDDNYAFVYTNPEKGSKKVLVKCLVMNNKLLVDALAEGASEPVHLEINVEDYVAESVGNYSDQFKNLEKLVTELDKDIISKLHCSAKPPISERGEGSRPIARDPDFGYFEHQGYQPYATGIPVPPINPSRGSDLFPGPGAGMYPRRGGFGGDGSMLVGPDDPRFFGGVGGDPISLGGSLFVPPGARFDPYGPPGTPGFEPNRFVRNPRRSDGTHPDLEHRPGGGSDFI